MDTAHGGWLRHPLNYSRLALYVVPGPWNGLEYQNCTVIPVMRVPPLVGIVEPVSKASQGWLDPPLVFRYRRNLARSYGSTRSWFSDSVSYGLGTLKKHLARFSPLLLDNENIPWDQDYS